MVVQSLEAADSRCELGVPMGGSDGMLPSGVKELGVVLALACSGASSAIRDVTDGDGSTSGLRSCC